VADFKPKMRASFYSLKSRADSRESKQDTAIKIKREAIKPVAPKENIIATS